MPLQAKYDPQEDRIRLTLQTGDGQQAAYWVTRRQWLALIHSLSAHAAMQHDPGAKPAPAVSKSAAPQKKGKAVKTSPEGPPSPLRAIRLRPMAHCLKLVLTATEGHVGVELPYGGLGKFTTMLQQTAEASGWDCAAALSRLSAVKKAGAATTKTKRYLH